MEEEFKIITGFEIYEVSNFGNVRHAKTLKIEIPAINAGGYCYFSFYIIGRRTIKTVHRLVAEHFLENPDNKQCVDHIDNNRLNNNLLNLRYATLKENGQNTKLRRDNTSGHKGVSYNKTFDKWRAQITIDGIKIHIGYYEHKEDAIQARITRANQAFGVFVNSCEKV